MSEMSILSGGNPSRVCLRLISDGGKPPRSPGRAKNSRLLKERGGKRESERVGLPPIGQAFTAIKTSNQVVFRLAPLKMTYALILFLGSTKIGFHA